MAQPWDNFLLDDPDDAEPLELLPPVCYTEPYLLDLECYEKLSEEMDYLESLYLPERVDTRLQECKTFKFETAAYDFAKMLFKDQCFDSSLFHFHFTILFSDYFESCEKNEYFASRMQIIFPLRDPKFISVFKDNEIQRIMTSIAPFSDFFVFLFFPGLNRIFSLFLNSFEPIEFAIGRIQ